MKVGAVPLWLLLLLSERPMYGYEIIRELEKRFSGYWRPKTGTIYPALDKLEQGGLVTSRIEFRDQGPDRKHYALTERGEQELTHSMAHWTRMMGVLEDYREEHESIFRYKDQVRREQLSRILVSMGRALGEGPMNFAAVVPSKKRVVIRPTEPLTLKLLYAKEGDDLEVHMEFEWSPHRSVPFRERTSRGKGSGSR